MIRHFPKHILVGLIIFLLLIQIWAVYEHMYFHLWWLDIPVHIIGGAWIALSGLTFYYSRREGEPKEHSPIFVVSLAVALTLVIGISWEIYEFAVEHAVGDSGISLADSLKDLVDDFIGALIATSIFLRGGYNRISTKHTN